MGLGSAKAGVENWWAERVSAVALVPLTLWFVTSMIAHTRGDYAGLIAWLRELPTTVFMILLLVALFQHLALGLQVIVEDYVHSSLRLAAIVVVRLGCFAIAIIGIFATLHIAWSR
jgi:succinate dehydrogenase / fumarate reductase membrane anchor subunit